jgi:hypothetical protein
VLFAFDDAGTGNKKKISRADPDIVDLEGSRQFSVPSFFTA